MNELYYTPYSLAILITIRDLSEKKIARFLEIIWKYENHLLDLQYRASFRSFILDTYYWIHYFYDKNTLDAEFPSIQNDMLGVGGSAETDKFTSEFPDLDLFFQNMRVRIIYDGYQDYVRIKLRTLLKAYGYQRRSKMLMDYMNHCMESLQLKVFLRGGVQCTLQEANLDDMLTFRAF